MADNTDSSPTRSNMSPLSQLEAVAAAQTVLHGTVGKGRRLGAMDLGHDS